LARSAIVACPLIAAGACASLDPSASKATPVSLAAFTQPRSDGSLGPPPRSFRDALPVTDAEPGGLAGGAEMGAFEEEEERLAAQEPARAATPNGSAAKPADPKSGPPAAPAAPPGTRTEPAVTLSETWLVDGLVGQVNGRPVFADEFLKPIEARLQELAMNPDRAAARRSMQMLIRERFNDYVNSEIIISEAEGSLTAEQQQGFFSWLKTLQETAVSERGGNLAEARKSLEDEYGMSVDEFLEQRRDAALASYLLQRKVQPRTIVSWSDIEREYRNRFQEFNPKPSAKIGSIRVPSRDVGKVESVKAMVADGKSFAEIAETLKVEKGGLLLQLSLEEGQTIDDGLAQNESLRETMRVTLREKLKDVPVGKATEAVVVGETVVWYGVIELVNPPKRGLYDPDVQLELKAELTARRNAIERTRYLAELRSRWVSDDIARIEERLLLIAFSRYWRV
jgi:hypothetical protein